MLLFQVPGASVLLFNFTFFNIVDQTDMVELLDGNSNRVVARFDGRNPPRDIVNITADFVILYFFSDRTNEAQGFSVLYQGEDFFWFIFGNIWLSTFIYGHITANVTKKVCEIEIYIHICQYKIFLLFTLNFLSFSSELLTFFEWDPILGFCSSNGHCRNWYCGVNYGYHDFISVLKNTLKYANILWNI